MEVATVAVGLAALRFVPFGFVTAPIAFALWYMSMDVTPMFAGGEQYDTASRCWVSLWFGLAMIFAAYAVDRRTRGDFAFWGYLFGLFAFWGGATVLDFDTEWSWFAYFCVNVVLIALAVFLHRRAFLVFGALGVFGYVGHLAGEIFEDSVLFPVAVTAVGVAVIYLGILIRRHGARWEQAAIAALPEGLRRLRPAER
jgi:hypothetical protein